MRIIDDAEVEVIRSAAGRPAPALESETGAHGNDERIAIDGFGRFVEFIYRSVIDVAAGK
jgi:hypothetical protein